MKSKIVSLILSVAVIVGLMLVPVAPTAMAQGDDWAYEISPSISKAACGDNFTVTVKAVCYAGSADTWQIMVGFDPTKLQCNSITRPGTLPNPPDNSAPDGYPGEPTINNTAGWVYDGYGVPPATALVNTSFNAWTIEFECLACNVTTINDINFTVVNPYFSTQVIRAGTDYLNWTEVVNGTAWCGAPSLTVNITPQPHPTMEPGGIGIVYDVVDPLHFKTMVLDPINFSFPNTTTWSWDEEILVAAVNMVPGWGFVTWLGDIGPYYATMPFGGYTVQVYFANMTHSRSITAVFMPLPPDIGVAPTSLEIYALEGINPDNETLLLWNSGGGTLNWSMTDDAAWLSENPTSGSLTTLFTVQTQNVDVCVNVSGLSVADYPANITITGASSETVPVVLHVLPATAIDVCRNIMASTDSGKPGETTELYAGETFNVYVNFTAPKTLPANGFNAIGLTDLAPPGWTVQVNKNWCSPAAYAVDVFNDNQAEILWSGPINEGVNVSAMYKVTVPTTATPGINTFPNCDINKAWLEYYFNEEGPYTSCVKCEYQVVVTQPGDIVGEVRDVNAAELSNADVALYLDGAGWLRSDTSAPNYTNTAWVLGNYWLVASKDCYYEINTTDMTFLAPKIIGLTTQALLAAGATFDFEGNYGLVPMTVTMSYAGKSVNLWKFPPSAHPEWGIAEWKAMDSINSWLYPTGC